MHRNWQDGGSQFVVDCGKNHLDSLFIDGFGSNAIAFLGAIPYTAPDGKPNFVREAGDEFVIDKAYIYDGHLALYVNKSASQGIVWRIKELYVGGMTDTYATITGAPKVNYYLEHAGTDKVIIEKLFHDGSRPNISKDPSKIEVQSVELLENFPRPIYKYNHYKFLNWSQTVADYHPIANGTRMKYTAGQYIMDREQSALTLFMKCLKDHTAHTIRPKADPEYFITLTWDKNGVCSDAEGWDSESEQCIYPGDNFTHVASSPLKDYFWLTEGQTPVETEVEVTRLTIKNEVMFAYTADNKYQVGPVTKLE